MHTLIDCPMNQHLAQVNRGQLPLCDHCYGFDPVADACRYLTDALIKIATAFSVDEDDVDPYCIHCSGDLEFGCDAGCPGLYARRALLEFEEQQARLKGSVEPG